MATVLIDKLLQACVKQGASDIHLARNPADRRGTRRAGGGRDGSDGARAGMARGRAQGPRRRFRRALTCSRRPPTRWPRMATWRSGYAADCKSVYTGSIPVVASNT